MSFLYATKIKPVKVSVNILYSLETSENHRFLMFSRSIKGNIGPKWVKQLQHRQEWHNLILFAWSASSSTVKQNDCKNKTTRLTQIALPKPFSLFHATYIEDIKEFFLKDYVFVQNLFDIKRLSNEIVFKFSKNVDLNIKNDLKIG